eukprot:TRINITY_DN572_c0_g1_i20.p2 TRINITY_DN572_c0_g1~~TRINITY_DN572_c0_g1_i20.p2  ORF type:complete len:106 (-),score=27.73 TRINITY_DN572_c0_g1_i20:118-435(-)
MDSNCRRDGFELQKQHGTNMLETKDVFGLLEINTSLKILSLRGCGIGPHAAIRIAEMLEKNSSLLSLDLAIELGSCMEQKCWRHGTNMLETKDVFGLQKHWKSTL